MFSVTLLSHCLDLSIFHSLRCSIVTLCVSTLFVNITRFAFSPFVFYSVFKVQLRQRFRCLVGSSGLEPPTLRLSGARSNHLSYEPVSLYVGGDEGIRTLDPLLAGQVLSQLSYTPVPLYFRSPGLFPLLGSLFSLRFSSSSRAMKTEQQASVPDSVLLLFFCRDSFFLYLDF